MYLLCSYWLSICCLSDTDCLHSTQQLIILADGWSDRPVDIFCSLRFAEAMDQAKQVQEILRREHNVKAFIVAPENGDNIMDQIVAAISQSQMAILFGTVTYGKGTTACFSTKEELQFVRDENKPYFLIKMCERFSEARTRMVLNNSVMYNLWLPNTPMPAELIKNIMDKFQRVRSDAV